MLLDLIIISIAILRGVTAETWGDVGVWTAIGLWAAINYLEYYFRNHEPGDWV